jgi:hypothetical protein
VKQTAHLHGGKRLRMHEDLSPFGHPFSMCGFGEQGQLHLLYAFPSAMKFVSTLVRQNLYSGQRPNSNNFR